MVSNPKAPMLDYVNKLMLLELVRSTMNKDLDSVIWLEKTMRCFYHRWKELDDLKKGP
jgi:hypothetical protein